MTVVHANKALLTTGWANDVRLEIEHGRIATVRVGEEKPATGETLGLVLPGLSNAHSHAFQRALAGHTEQRSPLGMDNFWSWRERMYELAAVVDAKRLRAIACQAYVEMLESGYTAVAEFHYLHREPGQQRFDDRMFQAIRSAAADAGIRLTYVPVLYQRAGFADSDPNARQRRFVLEIDEYLDHVERTSDAGVDVALAVHSLRAVSSDAVAKIAEVAAESGRAMHIHVAEQQSEVDECLRVLGSRPVEWLLRNYNVSQRWNLVHATHINAEESAGLAQSGAVVTLCPTTEANLGDGLFPLRDYLAEDGAIAIGSDSHISINPFEELRWLEYGQRLFFQSRNIATLRREHNGIELFERVLAGGARISSTTGGLCEGAYADLLVLSDDDPMFAGHDDATLLDALVFSGFRLPVERVMVDGRWRVEAGEHAMRQQSATEFKRAVTGITRKTGGEKS